MGVCVRWQCDKLVACPEYPAPRPMVVPGKLKKNMHSCCKLLLTYSKLSFLCHTEAGNSIKYM